MAEMLPLSQAKTVTRTLLDYLGTTFALADPDTRRVLDEFLQHPETGIFRGPYVRVRLPFRPAADGWREHLEWYAGFTPYGHQARAFERLSTYHRGNERPEPTLVTTGTGSGKTEAFLYPIVDHVQRANRAGVTGTKALILYPMNALANDQAKRLTEMIMGNAELAGVSAALYTGEAGQKRTKVTKDGLITDREIIRDTAPDILLTNYKMLDQLLLRASDAAIWRQSARSLTYLVLDEFHTYDGAQGTDVSMLLRRLGITLKSHWQTDDSTISADDWARPLGRITPVATSATLGDGGDPVEMLDFAETVFGERFSSDAVVTESRLGYEEWADSAGERVAAAGWVPISEPDRDQLLKASAELNVERRALAVLEALYTRASGAVALVDGEPLMLDLVKAHPVVATVVGETRDATPIDDSLPEAAIIDLLSHVRAKFGRSALNVDVHLWIRELTRLGRAATGSPEFVWDDDGLRLTDPDGAPTIFLPAVYCRHCNRSGWGVTLGPTGWELDSDDTIIRRRKQRNDDRFRSLIHAPAEAAAHDPAQEPDPNAASRLAWLVVSERRISLKVPPEKDVEEGNALPVLVHTGDSAGADSVNDTCPSCRQADGIRFLGSAISTMLSVSLSTMFGTPELDSREKRALVFTDSVQDAAHRAGFIQSRSHALTLRTLVRQALAAGESDLDSLAHRLIDAAGTDRSRRYRLLPPELAEREAFAPFWNQSAVAVKTRNRVRRRLLLDIQMEFGLRSGVGRTLESTGSAVATVDVSDTLLRTCAGEALEAAEIQLSTNGSTDAQLLIWVRGVLERMRTRGAIDHEWFNKFRQQDGNRWWVTGGRDRGEGMPGFGKGNSAPAFPVLGGTARDTDLEPVASARGWYATWTAKVLGVSASEGAVLARLLFGRLLRRDVVGEMTSAAGAQTFHLPASTVVAKLVDDADIDTIALICYTCRNTVYGYPQVINHFDGAPCLVARCDGRQRRDTVDPGNFYRHMYALTDIRRIVAREHTSLLDDAVRLRYETEFKQHEPPPNAPNVLVATPTLEMGIDIGDLSAVLLSSLPASVASYLQRVGRAGRLTGNALALAYVTGRGDQLPRFKRPEDTINGAVRPPATYLDAEEILRRQFTASVADLLARDPNAPHPRTPRDALGSTAPGSFLGELLALAASRGDELVENFVIGFKDLHPDVVARLREFPSGHLPARCHKASKDWNRRIEILNHRRAAAERVLPELQERAESAAATDGDRRDYRTAKSALGLINKQLAESRSEYWISALEVYGLFPNYTLLDDSVVLSVSVNWRNPETQDYENSEFELVRGSSAALREFAPGSTFYAHGFAINIDAIDVGASGEDIRTWVCCPRCGYVKELENAGAAAPTGCPRCASPAIADISQRLPVAELTNVSALIRREEAAIDDSAEDRRIERFVVVPLADIDSAGITRHWFVETLGLGAKHLRDVRLRWINMGRSGSGGGNRIIGGDDVDAALFRVCSECGKLDTLSGANRPSEHRPWCSLRKSADESTLNIGLARSMVTEGLVLRLPTWITLGDNFAIPSLSAAVLLGLREKIGGNPDHLQIVPTVDPRMNGQNVDALLLHDVVPGGTGYLTDFTDPATVWDLLHRAWRVVRDCPCQHDGRLACERCLLPFTRDVKRTSRAVAQRHLAGLLAGHEFMVGEAADVPETMPWTITLEEGVDDDPESNLEKRFRVVLAERLKALGATVVEKPSHNGVAWEIAMSPVNRWTLRPQEYVLGCQPDFVLTSAQGGVPPTAIFTDGWIYHATAARNRLADDAEKRGNLRDAAYQVIAVTHQDLEGVPVDSPSLRKDLGAKLLEMARDQISKSMVESVFKTAVDLLVSWIASPSRDARERLANWVPALGLMSTSQTGKRSTTADPLHLVALDAPTGSGDTFLWRQGGFAFAARMPGAPTAAEVAVVLDDDDEALTVDSRDAWRDWLRWSNLLNFRALPSTITTRKHAPHLEHATSKPAAEAGPTAELTSSWQEVYDLVDVETRSLVIDLAFAHVPEPAVGEEIAGIPIEIAWPSRKITIANGLNAEERADLVSAGWTVCDPDAEAIKAALQNGES
jgi:ATP-dependent helicase YprA (DUF1998 family)